MPSQAIVSVSFPVAVAVSVSVCRHSLFPSLIDVRLCVYALCGLGTNDNRQVKRTPQHPPSP